MLQELFSLHLTSAPHIISQNLAHIESKLDGTLHEQDVKANLLIVLAEVLNNVSEHAYEGQDDGQIACGAHIADDVLCIKVSDGGRPMPAAGLPQGVCPDLNVASNDFPEGGFGWFLIHSLCDDMTYERAHGQNHLSFSFALS